MQKAPLFSCCSQAMHKAFGSFIDLLELGQKHILCNHLLTENKSEELGEETQEDRAKSAEWWPLLSNIAGDALLLWCAHAWRCLPSDPPSSRQCQSTVWDYKNIKGRTRCSSLAYMLFFGRWKAIKEHYRVIGYELAWPHKRYQRLKSMLKYNNYCKSAQCSPSEVV